VKTPVEKVMSRIRKKKRVLAPYLKQKGKPIGGKSKGIY